MKIYVNEVNVSNDVDLSDAVFEGYATNRANRLFLTFNDFNDEWQNWILSHNDTIRLVENHCDTKTMFIHSQRISSGECFLFAKSIPNQFAPAQEKIFNDIYLSDLANRAASEIDFTADMSYTADRHFDSITVDNKSMLQVLKEICAQEGIGLVFYDQKIILFDEAQIINSEAPTELIIENDEFSLHRINNRLTGNVLTDLHTELAAGSTIRIDGSIAIIYKIRHYFMNKASKIFFKY